MIRYAMVFVAVDPLDPTRELARSRSVPVPIQADDLEVIQAAVGAAADSAENVYIMLGEAMKDSGL